MIVAIVAIVAIAGSMIYYFVFFRTGIEKAEIRLQEQKFELEKQQKRDEEIKTEQEKQEKEIQESLNKEFLAKCLDDAYQIYTNNTDNAYKVYIENWNAECKRLGRAPDSLLPKDIAEELDEDYNSEVERIDKLYENAKADCFKFWQN